VPRPSATATSSQPLRFGVADFDLLALFDDGGADLVRLGHEQHRLRIDEIVDESGRPRHLLVV
jgi:hypothetical protein